MNQQTSTDVLPEAYLSHHSPGRLRIRITAKRGDTAYFQNLQEALARHFGDVAVTATPATGSILITDRHVSPDAVGLFAREKALFMLPSVPPHDRLGVQGIVGPIKAADNELRRITGGRLDMPSAVFAALVLFGIVEVLRGNIKSPPWYTAFWYAFGLFSKTLMDRSKV